MVELNQISIIFVRLFKIRTMVCGYQNLTRVVDHYARDMVSKGWNNLGPFDFRVLNQIYMSKT